MLAFEEKDRISWKEVFDCELLNPKKENLEATLKQSMQMAEKMCKSTLNMSRTVNKMYFEEHKVVQKVELNTQEEKKVEEITEKVTEKEKEKDGNKEEQEIKEKEKDDLFKSIAQKHDTAEKRKAIIKNITNYFLSKRNKAVFVNHLSLKIY
jgi:hypothetical protein